MQWYRLSAVVMGLMMLTVPASAADKPPKKQDSTMTHLQVTDFGKTPEGEATKLFTFRHSNGSVLKLTDYGASIVALEVPGRDGTLANVALGFDSAAAYAAHTANFGCTVGRFANRIAKGKFTLDGKEYTLVTNNGPNHLHGGNKGFSRAIWKSEGKASSELCTVVFTHRSPDGDEGYPGVLEATVTFTFDGRDLKIDYSAEASAPTVVNLTNHCYWNLAGSGSGDVLGHVLRIDADRYTAVDKGLIPTGELAPVQGTPLDFNQAKTIGQDIDVIKAEVDGPGGYDHCYVLHEEGKGPLALAAKVVEPTSGRVMEVLTTEPGVQLYTGNFLDGAANNGGHQRHYAFCLETQHFPDSPNKPEFPTTTLRPGETFSQTTVYRFGVE